jgi:DNA-binding NarL/FixJ family response regulator
MSNISVLLAEDHTIVRKGLVSILENELGIEVVGEAEDGREAIQKVEELEPDIVVMDISMPILNGLDATKQIKKRFPQVKVIILTMHINEEYILEVLHAGASGYVIKQAVPTELITAIDSVYHGEVFLSPKVSKTVIQEYLKQAQAGKEKAEPQLTDREREIVQLIAEGHSNRKIAEMLYISIKTVEAHRSKIMEKLDLHSVADITRYAIRKGIVSANH